MAAKRQVWVRSHIEVKAYAERLAAGLSVVQLSAIAAIWCAERRPPGSFGRLDDWGDLVRLIEPRERELAEIDTATWRLGWAAAAWRAWLRRPCARSDPGKAG